MEKEIHSSDMENLKIIRDAQEFYELMNSDSTVRYLASKTSEKEKTLIWIINKNQ